MSDSLFKWTEAESEALAEQIYYHVKGRRGDRVTYTDIKLKLPDLKRNASIERSRKLESAELLNIWTCRLPAMHRRGIVFQGSHESLILMYKKELDKMNTVTTLSTSQKKAFAAAIIFVVKTMCSEGKDRIKKSEAIALAYEQPGIDFRLDTTKRGGWQALGAVMNTVIAPKSGVMKVDALGNQTSEGEYLTVGKSARKHAAKNGDQSRTQETAKPTTTKSQTTDQFTITISGRKIRITAGVGKLLKFFLGSAAITQEDIEINVEDR